MPSDDKSKYDDDDIFTRDEDDLFKKYSLKEGKNYRSEKEVPSKYGSENDPAARLRRGKDFSENYDNYDEYSESKDAKRLNFDNDDDSYTEPKNEKRASRSKDMESDDFFKDEDFDIKDFGQEDRQDDGGFRSIKTKKKKRRIRVIISSLVIMVLLTAIAIGLVFGIRFLKNKSSKTEAAAATTEQSIVVPGSMKLGKDLSIVICGAGVNLLEPDINSVIFSKYSSTKTELISLCVPTNTLFEIPGFGLDSIKKSVEYGGMDLIKLSLKNNIGMDVSNYLLMDILNTVNKLEGIKLTLDKALAISTPEGAKIDLKEGDNILNGETALNFMKYYSGNTPELAISDVRMQKLLIDSIMRKIVGSKDGELAKNLTIINDFIDTDLNLEELSEFISTAAGISDELNKSYALDGRFESTDEETGSIVFVPDIARVLDIFKQESSVPVDTAVVETGQTMTVSVLNGVGTKGLASKTAELLKGLKFADGTVRYSVTNVGDAPSKYEKTQVVLKLPDESFLKSAEYLMSVLFVGASVNDETKAQATDLILIIGKDFDLEIATQKAAEAAAGTSSSDGSAETSSESSETTAEAVAAGEVFILNILNGEGTSGIALTVKSILEKELNNGQNTIKVQETKNADNFKYTATKVIIHTDKAGIKEMAESIKKTLGIGAISESSTNPDKVDITIVIGSDYTK